MLKFTKLGSTQTQAIWPDVTASLATQPSGGLDIILTQDYDNTSTVVDGTLLNTPTEYTPRIVFSVSTAEVPSYSGLYSYVLREFITEDLKWKTANLKWGEADVKWGAGVFKKDLQTIDEGRAIVQGTDTPSTTTYSGGNTGLAYTTYHK